MIHMILTAGDVAPAPLQVLKDQNGTPLDLSSGTVRFQMENYHTGHQVLDQEATILQNNQNSNTFGQVVYYWNTNDTSIPGLYRAWFLSQLGSGPQHHPADGSFLIMIRKKP